MGCDVLQKAMKSPSQSKSRRLRLSRVWAPKRSIALSVAVAIEAMHVQRLPAENQIDYRYENYIEDDNRIEVKTHSALFDVAIKEGLLAIKGELVHDAVSGATPSGAAPPKEYNYDWVPILGFQPPILGNTNGTSVPLKHMDDERKSISLELPITLGRHELTPQVSYSDESDYKSTGAALNYSIQLNEKNTTLSFGWAHSWDVVNDDRGRQQDKNSDDFLVGLNQLLGPKTVLGLNLSYGHSHGYLNDPYRSIVGATDPQLNADDPSRTPEERPDSRDKYIARVSLTQFITPLHASVEGAYRFYHDDFGIDAHMVELAWYQKLAKNIIVSPNFRYYYQTQADFYYEILPGSIYNPPRYYSPDYRLSEFEAFSYGVNVTLKMSESLMFDASYKRYTMEGLDGHTSQSAYPSANVFSVGARIFF